MASKTKHTLLSGYELGLNIGGDPELFLSRKGAIVGSERAINEKGLKGDDYGSQKIVRDGVQVELQLSPFTCRAAGGSSLASAMRTLRKHLLEAHPSLVIDFRQVIDVEKEEMDGLSDKSRILGCDPSLNIYEQRTIDIPPGFLMRSAGGHIHLGMTSIRGFHNYGNGAKVPKHPMVEDPTILVKVLDILLGNTCVLIDRDPRAADRRTVYGRAGEYRLPKHGLEYRVLSNFWLRSYPLASFVWGMARFAAGITHHSLVGVAETKKDRWGYVNYTGKFLDPEWNTAGELISLIDIEKVREAINTNDYKLARENFDLIRPWLASHTVGCQAGAGDGAIPLVASTLEEFDYFLSKGIDHWFPKHQTIMQWLCFNQGHGTGWESFLTGKVRKEMNEANQVEMKSKPSRRKKAA